VAQRRRQAACSAAGPTWTQNRDSMPHACHSSPLVESRVNTSLRAGRSGSRGTRQAPRTATNAPAAVATARGTKNRPNSTKVADKLRWCKNSPGKQICSLAVGGVSVSMRCRWQKNSSESLDSLSSSYVRVARRLPAGPSPAAPSRQRATPGRRSYPAA